MGLALLQSCCPEVSPFSLAPPCPPYASTQRKPCFPRNPCGTFPTQGDPALCPSTDTPLTLVQLIDIALRNSPDTRRTWAQARLAAAEYGESRSTYYPDISVEAYMDHLQDPFFTATRRPLIVERYTSYGPRLTLNYLLLDCGARQAESRAFCEALREANWTHNREIQSVVQEVTEDYYDYLSFTEQLAAAEMDLLNAQTDLAATQTKHESGISDISDVLLAETQVAQSELKMLEIATELSDSYVTLAASLGIPSNQDLKIKGLPTNIPLGPLSESVEELICTAYSCRPDYLAARAGIRSMVYKMQKAVRDQLPSLSFDGHVGEVFFNRGTLHTEEYLAEVKLTLPLFRGWYYWNRVRGAKANVEKSCSELRALEINMIREVVQAYRDFSIASDKVISGEEYVKAAERSYAATLEKYKMGTVDFTTVVTAQAQLADSRAALVKARRSWYVSLNNLAYATGSWMGPFARKSSCGC